MVQYFLRLRGQGENISLPCLLEAFFFLSRGLHFFKFSELSFIFTVVKELLFHIV